MAETDKRKNKSRQHLDGLIQRVLAPVDLSGSDPWKIEEHERLTLEDYVSMKPFKMEDHNSLISFRINEKVLRAVQRIKERSGGIYDLKSDLERDIFMVGLMVMAERYEDIFASEIVVERMQNRELLLREVNDQIHRFTQLLFKEGETEQRADFFLFMESLAKKPPKIQDLFMTVIKTNPFMVEMLRKMNAAEKRHGEN